MRIILPPVIQRYINANNAHDVKSILACFADDAVIHDENETHRGKTDIAGLRALTPVAAVSWRTQPSCRCESIREASG